MRLLDAQLRSRKDVDDLNSTLADVAESARRSHLACELLGPVALPESELEIAGVHGVGGQVTDNSTPRSESAPESVGARSATARRSTAGAVAAETVGTAGAGPTASPPGAAQTDGASNAGPTTNPSRSAQVLDMPGVPRTTRLTEPAGPFDAAPVKQGIAVAETAAMQRDADIDEVEKNRDDFDAAEEQLRQARSALERAESRVRNTAERLDVRKRRLRETRDEWEEQARGWASEAHPGMHVAGVHAPMTAALAVSAADPAYPLALGDVVRTATAAARTAAAALAESAADPSAAGQTGSVSSTLGYGSTPAKPEDVASVEDHDIARSLLLAEIDELVRSRLGSVAAAELKLEAEQATLDDAQALVDKLAERSEPDPPRLEWQTASDYCFADLIDFSPHLDSAERAGLEAALQASGLLSARVTADGTAELADGELVAVAAGGVDNPLSGCLTVTVPDRLNGVVDAEVLRRLLDSISCSTSDGDAARLGTADVTAAVASDSAVSSVPAGVHSGTPPTSADTADGTAASAAVARSSRSAPLVSSDSHTATAAVTAAAAAAATDGSFRIGSLRGRHSKENAEFIGVTARREALERERRQAAESLEQARAVVDQSRAELGRLKVELAEAEHRRAALPSVQEIVAALAEMNAATAAATEARTEREEAAQQKVEAEQVSRHEWDGLQRAATTLRLPSDRHALHEVRRELQETRTLLGSCRSRLETLRRSVESWIGAVAHWRETVDDLFKARESHRDARSSWQRERARLITIEDSIGAEYAEILAARNHCKTELAEAVTRMLSTRTGRDKAVYLRARLTAEASSAAGRRGAAERECEEVRRSLAEALGTPGYLAAVASRDPSMPEPESITSRAAGAVGLTGILAAVERLITPAAAARPADPAAISPDASPAAQPTHQAATAATGSSVSQSPTLGSTNQAGHPQAGHPQTGHPQTDADATADSVRQPLQREGVSGKPSADDDAATADSVRQSLRQRRDALGAGWDAEALQPDPLMPLSVEVVGPLGRAPLADSAIRVADQHKHLVGLLQPKQDLALRALLQGLIAREVAEKIHGARRLVELMNRRLQDVTTAHEVGVQLRWRRSPELEPTTKRMVELMARQPDLRTEEQESELRRALAEQIRQARAMHPDVPYRQLIADTLDYRQWHDMSVMLHRADSKPRKLGRRTPLSEGEKKLVTYLPLFAAVAASYDALTEQSATPQGDRPGIARFVLLDDAFAKVSEDNHAALFKLLVELDLDLIATSERLWGTHPDVPQLSIVEVVRDAKFGAILLEHYRWDGATLSRDEQQPTLNTAADATGAESSLPLGAATRDGML